MRKSVFRSLKDLACLVKKESMAVPILTEKPQPEPVLQIHSPSEEDLFETCMKDVIPLGWNRFHLDQPMPIEIQNPGQSEDEGLRLLTEFIQGKTPIDLQSSGEYIEGAPHPKGRLFLENLRNGRFAMQAHLDLHGLSVAEARLSFNRFIHECVQRGHGCIRIVHGRGHHSMDGRAMLKEHLQKWLNSRRMSRYIVAFTSARLYDGGGGALYVLLRTK